MEVNRPELLSYVSRPLIAFEPIAPSTFPGRWEEREYSVRMKLFGVVPIGRQVIGIERSEEGGSTLVLRDNGRSALAKRWDHVMTVERTEDGCTHYTDHVVIEAGALTPAIWAFARVFYAHRQGRWRRLVARKFRYHSPGA